MRESVLRLRDRLLQPGDALRDRDIVVFTEQGLGDSIMFARYLPMLAAAGARVTLACGPDLAPLLSHVAGPQRLLTPPPAHPTGKLNLAALTFDAFAPLMSLPHVFETTMATIPATVPYLTADPAQVTARRAHYQAMGRPSHRRVGVVFRANPATRTGTRRSIPIADLVRLARVPGIDLVNLQPGPDGREVSAAIPGMIDGAAEPMALDAYAAAIAATDLLISVDTMAAHCAGAMAHPVWVALSPEPEWRWAGEAGHSVWYPSARLFRQQADAGWAAVVDAMARRLEAGGDAF